MTDSQERTGRHAVASLVLALVAVFALFGALLGSLIPAHTGREEATVLSITFTISPLSLALYGAISVGTFLVTMLFVVEAVSRFEDRA